VRCVDDSTCTIIHVIDIAEAEISQDETPLLILSLSGKFEEIPKTGTEIDGQMIYKSKIKLQENDFLFTMSDGTVMNMLQTDTAINNGNSGGPLFNEYGQVIGIVSAKLSGSSNSEATVEGLGFAIPINDVRDMITSIIEHGYVTGKPNVGVLLDDVSQEAQRYGVPAGAEVMAVLDGSGADKGGLQAGDIITAVNGTEVSSVSALQEAVKEYKAGDKVTFSVYRDGDTTTVDVTLDEENQEREEAMNQLQQDYYEEQQAQQQQQQQQGGYFQWPFGW